MINLRRSFNILHIFNVLLCLLVIVGTNLGGRPVQAAALGTVWKDTITTNTTWTEAGNPYQIDIKLVIAKGATLTIEPGVIVENSEASHATSYAFEVQGTLLARGTAAKPIQFKPGPDGWSGINIIGEAGAINTGSVLEHVILDRGGFGASGSGGNLVLTYAEATMRNCQFNNGPGDGILADDAWGLANVYDSSFTNNAGYAIDFQDGRVNPVLSNLTATGNGYNDGLGNPLPYGGNMVFLGSSITLQGAHTWENMGLPYLIDQMTVGPDSVLTIEPGVHVLAKPGNDALDIQGTLIAEGTADQKIYLEPADAAAGWAGLRILGSSETPSQGNRLKHVILPKGGYGNDCNLYMEYGDAVVSGSQFTTGRTSGVCLGKGALLTMSNSLLEGNLEYAMDVRDPNAQFSLSGLTARGNQSDTIGVAGGEILGTRTWPKSGINTYDIHGDLVIGSQGALNLAAGTTLRFEYGRNVTIQGSLAANGTASAPILITAEEPVPGNWGGLLFRGTAAQPAVGRFTYTTLEYAGYGGYGMVEIQDSDVTFDHCTLRNASGIAIFVAQASNELLQTSQRIAAPVTQVTRSNLVNLGGYAIQNNSAQAVQASYNWWGSAKGPAAEDNPGGTGSPILGAVSYRPFLVAPGGFSIYLPMTVR